MAGRGGASEGGENVESQACRRQQNASVATPRRSQSVLEALDSVRTHPLVTWVGAQVESGCAATMGRGCMVRGGAVLNRQTPSPGAPEQVGRFRDTSASHSKQKKDKQIKERTKSGRLRTKTLIRGVIHAISPRTWPYSFPNNTASPTAGGRTGGWTSALG